MLNRKIIENKIYYQINRLLEKNILVEIEMPIDEKDKFSTYSLHELNSLKYKVTYIPKKIVLCEGEYFINFFMNFLVNLYTRSEVINYLLKDIQENADVGLSNSEYNSYFHFNTDKIIVNIDTFSESMSVYKKLIDVYDKNPKKFIKNIIKNDLCEDFNELMKKGKMRFFNSSIFNVKLKGEKYVVFTTFNQSEKIMYILDEDNNYIDILDDRYFKILKKLSLINAI